MLFRSQGEVLRGKLPITASHLIWRSIRRGATFGGVAACYGQHTGVTLK